MELLDVAIRLEQEEVKFHEKPLKTPRRMNLSYLNGACRR